MNCESSFARTSESVEKRVPIGHTLAATRGEVRVQSVAICGLEQTTPNRFVS